MKYFTNEENKPSKHTLNIIKQIAYTYRTIKLNGKNEAYCLNKKKITYGDTYFTLTSLC